MKYIICIVLIIICLFMGNRLANLDKPFGINNDIDDNIAFGFNGDARFEWESEVGVIITNEFKPDFELTPIILGRLINGDK